MKDRIDKTIIKEGYNNPIMSTRVASGDYLRVNNYLSEFKTREEKIEALRNLGIDKSYWDVFIDFSEGLSVGHRTTISRNGQIDTESIVVSNNDSVVSIKDGIIQADYMTIKSGVMLSNDGSTLNPIVCFRGLWQSNIKYAYYDEIAYQGSKYICTNKFGTTEVPGYKALDWILTQGSDELRIEIDSSMGLLFVNTVDTDLITRVYSGYNEVVDYDNMSFNWTRESSDKPGDIVWNNQHVGYGRTVTIRSGYDIPMQDDEVIFTCECVITLPEGALLRLKEQIGF